VVGVGGTNISKTLLVITNSEDRIQNVLSREFIEHVTLLATPEAKTPTTP
jgi:hypothetical protein